MCNDNDIINIIIIIMNNSNVCVYVCGQCVLLCIVWIIIIILLI